MKKTIVALAFVLMAIPRASSASCWLQYQNTTIVEYEYGGVTYTSYTQHYAIMCDSGGTSGTSGGGGGGGSTTQPPLIPPPPPPAITVNSISDLNPENLVLRVTPEYTDYFDLYVNNQYRARYAGTTLTVYMGSLRTFPGDDYSSVKLVGFGPGGEGTAEFYVDRWRGFPSAQHSFQVTRVFNNPYTGKPSVDSTSITRQLTTQLVYTDYTCAVSGRRNGYAFHERVFDRLLWTNFMVDIDWVSQYLMNGMQQGVHDLYPTYSSVPGFKSSASAGDPNEFARAYTYGGRGWIPVDGLRIIPSTETFFGTGDELVVYP